MTSQTSSDFLFNGMNMENIDNLDLSSDIKLEETSENTVIGNKRKLEVKSEAYKIVDSNDSSLKPQRKRMRLDGIHNNNNSVDSENNSQVATFPDLQIASDSTCTNSMPPPTPTPTQYLLPVLPTSHQHPHHPPQYFVPVVSHHLPPHPHINPYAHPIPFPHHMNMNMNMNPPPPHHIFHHPHPHPHYNGYHHPHHCLDNKNNAGAKTKRKNTGRNRKIKSEEYSDDNELLDDDGKNNTLITDKSPFKTTYISREEEIELKNTNNALYSQFHLARQAIYQQYKQKIEQTRHSNLLTPQKRKLNIKIAAIDAKVQEKKLFLTYLEMSRLQTNSWLISNSAISMNAFSRNSKISQQNTQQSENNNSNTPQINTQNNNQSEKKQNNNNNNKSDEKKEKKPATTSAKRVKKPKFSEYNVRVLRDWYETHTNNPYPSSSEKHLMCQLTGLTKYQVSRWFCNVRTRKPPPELSDNDEDIINTDHNKNNHNQKQKEINNRSPVVYHSEYYGRHPPPVYHPHPHPYAHHLAGIGGISPLNGHHLPPMTPIPITQNHHFNFMNIPNINPILSTKQQQNINENNMIDSENCEGLMPIINDTNTNLMPPPPLIDENSNSYQQS